MDPLTLALFVFGIIILVKGADFLIEGSTSIARRLKISDLVIGLTLVSFGTSLPELVVNIIASLGGNTDLLIGNILGSNISNILLIIGITALFANITIKHGTVWKEIPFSLLAAIVVAILANDALIDGTSPSQITKSDGLILLSFFAIFIYYVYGITRRKEDEVHHSPPKYDLPISVFYIVAGMLMLYLGGEWAVEGAVQIALSFGLSQAVVGLSVLAIGTSLPELLTSVMAIFKKRADLAIGNVVGSNIFNLFLVLGITSLINPIHFAIGRNTDILMVIASSVLLFLAALTGKEKMTIEKHEAALFVLLYLSYISYLFLF